MQDVCHILAYKYIVPYCWHHKVCFAILHVGIGIERIQTAQLLRDGLIAVTEPFLPITSSYGRARACCACSSCGMGGLLFFFFIFFISSIPSSFSNASSLWRELNILKYCGLSRYNPTVVVSYYRRRAH